MLLFRKLKGIFPTTLFGLLVFLLFICLPVMAETGSKSSSSQFKTGKDIVTLPEIVVTGQPIPQGYSVPNATTATKTDTPIIETPVSIQVVPRAVFDDQQAVRLEDILKNVSSFQPGNNNGGVYDTFFIRGFEIGFDIGTTTYRDGIRLRGYPSVTAGLERVEVLKGPASVLYGRLEPGGLVNVVTKKPLSDAYYSLQQQFGSYELYRTSVDATGPIPLDESGSLLYRFNIDYLDHDSFRDFVGGADLSRTQADLEH